MVFSGLSINTGDYEISRLRRETRLNDAAFIYTPEFCRA
jgi:hypothetical protein